MAAAIAGFAGSITFSVVKAIVNWRRMQRTKEKLASGLPWPREQVIQLHDDVVAALEKRGAKDAADRAYSGVMAAGAVCAAVNRSCPTLEMVMAIIDRGEQVLQRKRGEKSEGLCSK